MRKPPERTWPPFLGSLPGRDRILYSYRLLLLQVSWRPSSATLLSSTWQAGSTSCAADDKLARLTCRPCGPRASVYFKSSSTRPPPPNFHPIFRANRAKYRYTREIFRRPALLQCRPPEGEGIRSEIATTHLPVPPSGKPRHHSRHARWWRPSHGVSNPW